MIERGVRFINIYHEGWDAHSDVVGNLKQQLRRHRPGQRRPRPTSSNAGCSTKPSSSGAASSAAPRWSRATPPSAAAWAATIIPRPTPCGWPAAASARPHLRRHRRPRLPRRRKPVHVHDLQATLLHCLGFDHERLTYRHQGRDFRLTDVHGHVVRRASIYRSSGSPPSRRLLGSLRG
jgi:hypothetical protein